jgi:hypothetical protein
MERGVNRLPHPLMAHFLVRGILHLALIADATLRFMVAQPAVLRTHRTLHAALTFLSFEVHLSLVNSKRFAS